MAHLALFESWWPNWLAGQWPRSSAEELQGSVAGLKARNAQLVREVAELKSRLATAGSPNPTMRGSSSNERTKTTTTRERDDTKTGVSLGGATRRSAPDARMHLHLRQLANRTILLVGGSTVRMMATDLMMHAHETQMAAFREGEALQRRLACPSEWRVVVHPCDAARGFGCTRCVCCCGPGCSRRHAEPKTVGSAASWGALFLGWSDFTATCDAYALRIDFSWKPEMHTADDDAAFGTRFCAADAPRYDLALVGKGLHDAAFRPAPLPAFVAKLALQVDALGELLRCLPPTTRLLMRTPYWADAARSNGPLLGAAADLVRAAVAGGRFGPRAQLVDAFAFTRNDTRSPTTPPPYDGVHYPPVVQLRVWNFIRNAIEEGVF